MAPAASRSSPSLTGSWTKNRNTSYFFVIFLPHQSYLEKIGSVPILPIFPWLNQILSAYLFNELHAFVTAELPVQGAVLDGLRHVGQGQVGLPFPVGDGPGDLEDAGIGPGRKPEALHRGLQQAAGLPPPGATPFDPPGRQG